MIRRDFITLLGGLLFAQRAALAAKPEDPIRIDKLKLSEDEWRKRLSPQAFSVLRHEGPSRRARVRSTRKSARAIRLRGLRPAAFHLETSTRAHRVAELLLLLPGAGDKTIQVILPRTDTIARAARGTRSVFDDGPKPPASATATTAWR